MRCDNEVHNSCVSPDSPCAEVCELFNSLRRARVVWANAAVFRSKAQRQGYIKVFERAHLPVEPRLRVWPKAVCPTQSRSELFDLQFSKPIGNVVQARVFEVYPL